MMNASAKHARRIVDANQYMVIGSADAAGRPWASPVWFAHDGYREFVWVSSPVARHSTNIAERPRIGIVIFDSRIAIGQGQGVYLDCEAAAVPDQDLDRALEVFNRRSLPSGGSVLARSDVEPPADALRLYRAVAESASMLAKDGRPDHRIPADLDPR